MAKVRHNIYIPDFLAAKVDEFAAKMGVNRGVAYTIILRNFFEQQDMLITLPELLEKVKNLEVSISEESSKGKLE